MCVGSLFGGGATPSVQKVNPTPTTVTNSDISGGSSGDSEALKKQKKKQQQWKS